MKQLAFMRQRPFAYAEIFLNSGEGERAHKNESNCTVFLRDGAWFTTWGQGICEGHPDERIVFSVSRDLGKSWSSPQVIDQSDMEREERVAYGIPFVVPRTGRIYLFFFVGLNTEGKLWVREQRRDVNARRYPEHDSGILHFRYSDDDGQSWSERYRIDLPDRDINAIRGRIHGWVNHPPQILPNGEVVFTTSHYRSGYQTIRCWQLGAAECNLVRCVNLLTEDDPAKLEFQLLPEGPYGIRTNLTAHWDNPLLQRHLRFWNGRAEETGWSFQEMTIVPAPDGRLIGIGRTYLGAPGYTVSHDQGRTWSNAEPLCYTPGGAPIRHPMTMCPAALTSNGKVVLLFTDNDGTLRGAQHQWDGDGRTRNPQYFTVGKFVPGEERNGGLAFGDKVLLAEVDDSGTTNLKTGVSMPHFFERDGRSFIAYNVNKEHLLLDEIPAGYLQ